MTVVELSGVHKRFDEQAGTPGQEVLRGVDLSIEAGARVSIVGASGCGKSTLLNIIGGLDRPTSGTVSVAGQNLTSAEDDAVTAVRNQKIGFVFQDHHLLPQATVLENVLMPCFATASKPSDEQLKRARELLDRVGLGNRHDDWPQHLSGGERQRVAVARSLVMAPPLLLADEPTGALDTSTATTLTDLLNDVQQATGVALVIVTHSPALAAAMDTRYVIKDGQLELADS